MEFIGSCIIKNGSIEPLDEQAPIGDDNEIYEVLRIEGARPLFITDHLDRWQNSMKALGRDLPKWANSFSSLIDWLIACNTLPNCDMRIVSSADGTIQCGYVQTEYPTADMYAKGVRVELLNAVRENPRLKIFHADMRSEASRQQDKMGAYESLLVNNDGRITEGSRSNVYFISADGTITTASDDDVLGGIMRKHVLDLCRAMGIKLQYELVSPADVGAFDSAFLSSTPMRILPISQIEANTFNVDNSVLRALMTSMDDLVSQQIKG